MFQRMKDVTVVLTVSIQFVCFGTGSPVGQASRRLTGELRMIEFLINTEITLRAVTSSLHLTFETAPCLKVTLARTERQTKGGLADQLWGMEGV